MSEIAENTGLIHGQEHFLKALTPDEFTDFRMKAWSKWKETSAPSTRHEYWKYTRLNPILKKSYSIVEKNEPFNSEFLRSFDYYNLVFVNGVFDNTASVSIHDKNLVITDLITAKQRYGEVLKTFFKSQDSEDYFSLLNEAFHLNGPYIHIGKNMILDKPVRILHVIKGEDRLVNIKGYIRVEEGAQCEIIETWDHDLASDNLANSRLDIRCDSNARTEFVKMQSVGNNHLINQDFIEQQRDSRFTIHTISTDGKLIRNNLTISLKGENAEANLNGLYLASGSEHIDNHTTVHHLVPNCNSNELYKGIARDKAKTVFNGKVIVHKDAQKTNAFQSNANILLDDSAEIYSKPELEIYADDVKCSHGSTTGQLDEEALFYLRSRGLSAESARNLLIYAFSREVLDRIPIGDLKNRIIGYLGNLYHVGEND